MHNSALRSHRRRPMHRHLLRPRRPRNRQECLRNRRVRHLRPGPPGNRVRLNREFRDNRFHLRERLECHPPVQLLLRGQLRERV